MDFEHIVGLSRISHYKSPPAKIHVPRKIQSGLEEIEVIVSGCGWFFRDAQAYEAIPGSILWFYEGDNIEATSDHENPYEAMVFVYSVEKIPKYRMSFFSSWENALSCEKFCGRALKSFNFEAEEDETLTFCTYARLVWENSESVKHHKRKNVHPAIEKAVLFMEKNFSAKIAIGDIAQFAGLSSSHLHLVFREEFGMSPFQYVLKMRLAKAQEFLLSSGKPVKQICDETGFGDIKNFYSYFKHNNKMTPAEFRRSF